MSDFKLYSIYDRVAGSYGELFAAQKDELAARRFQYVLSNSPMVALDCDLYCHGSYDVESGVITSFEKPVFVCRYEVKSDG